MRTFDISGFGGGYEASCQKMLTAGLKFLSDKLSFDWNSYAEFENIIGVVITKGNDGTALDQVLFDAAEEAGCTGAMHQAVINHLRYISKHSYREWIEEASKQGPDAVYEIDDPEREALVRSVEGLR